MSELKLNFKNYKKLDNLEVDLSQSVVMLVKGPNDAGKSTVLQGLVTILTGKELASEPVTRGFSDGEKTLELTSIDGKKYTLIHEFTNDKNKFYAIDENGKKIGSITDFRNIFKYTHFTAEEFVNMSNSAEGRRKQMDLLLNVLSEQDKEAYNTQEAYEEKYYKERTDFGKAMETWNAELKAVNITTTDKELYARKEEIQSTYNQLLEDKVKLQSQIDNESKSKEEYDKIQASIYKIEYELTKIPLETKSSIDNINTEIIQLEAIIAQKKVQIKTLEDKERSTVIELNNKFNDLFKQKKDFVIPDLALIEEYIKVNTERLSKGKEVINNISYVEKNLDKYNNAKDKVDINTKAYNDANEKLEQARKAKKDIVAKSDLSKFNIKFEDGYLYVDDFKFDSNQICTSKVYKLVARIMMSINKDCPILIMGKGSELDNNSLDELYDLAEANGRHMIYDEVDRTKEELVVVGYSKGQTVNKPVLEQKLLF